LTDGLTRTCSAAGIHMRWKKLHPGYILKACAAMKS
jgi:hypothetical protein